MHKRNPIWWNRPSAVERCLTVVAVSRLFLCIALAVGKAEALGIGLPTEYAQTVSEQVGNGDVCSSPECFRTASTVLEYIDPDVEPCDDFYRFACGGFLKSTSVPDDEKRVTSISIINDKLKKQVKAMMEEPSEPNERKPFRLVKTLYKSCTDETAREGQGLQPLHKILKKLGGWPVLDGTMWNEANFDWISSTYKLRDAGYHINYLFNSFIMIDWNDETKHVIGLDSADLGMNYDDLLEGVDNEAVKAYYNYMVDIAVHLGAERERASIELKESLLFEINLANISLTIAERMNYKVTYKRMTLDELTNNNPSIPWREYFGKLLPKDIAVDENEIVQVIATRFISDLEKLLSETPKRIQANYVIWRAVKDSVSYLNDDFRTRELAYRGIITESTSRSQECANLIIERLPIAVGAMYVRKYFKAEAKQNVVDIVADIRQQFYKIIQQVEWMDARLRIKTLERATSIYNHVAYSEELVNEMKLEKLYENLELSGGNYFDSILNLTFFDIDYSFRQLRELPNRNNWVSNTNPAVAQIYYNLYSDSIHFSAGVLQVPIFGNDRPNYMNYGSIGVFIGLEVALLFRYIEWQFDKDGNPIDWPKENYLKRVECMIHQYGNYTVEEFGLQLNGIQKQQENIADNAGVKLAYLAYNDWIKRNEPEQKLPGLPYTPNQMFWISAASPWCEKWKPEALKHRITTDALIPNEYRILGSLSNMPEFSKDFNCPSGSKMNPEKKCSVWFGVNNDKDKALAGCGARGTMVTRHNYFDKPKWTTCSRTAFQSYFRSTHEICAYSRRVGEVPDAVKSMPGAWISIKGQCDNIFKDSSDVCIDEFPGCSKYGCKRDGDCNWISHPPMRGSLTLHQNRTVVRDLKFRVKKRV